MSQPAPQPREESEVIEAAGGHLLAAARTLLAEYRDEVRAPRCFGVFQAELDTLPGEYAPPRGRLLLARVAGDLAGCIALRPIDDRMGEVKRLYVRTAHRGRGVGKALAQRVIDEARRAGYERLRLDTLPTMCQAQDLYQHLGFRDIPPYNDNPEPGVRYMELVLAAPDPEAVRRGVIEALRSVHDPEIPVNVVDLGLVREVDVADAGVVRVRMTLTSPNCPVAGEIPVEARRRVLGVPGVRAAEVELVWDPPWQPDMMSASARLALEAMGVAVPSHDRPSLARLTIDRRRPPQ